jgi:DNA-binding protein WhiA
MILLDEIKNEILSKKQSREKNDSGVSKDAEFVREAILTRARGGFSSGYHFEFIFHNINEARALCEILAQYEIFPKMTVCEKIIRVYIKNSDCICNLLALIGTNKCLLELHDQIALRSVRNTTNRRANCDAANISKQIAAANRQAAMIVRLKQSGGFDLLDEVLRRTAEVRLEHPDASIDELAEILNISKSGAVHRLKRLCVHAGG